MACTWWSRIILWECLFSSSWITSSEESSACKTLVLFRSHDHSKGKLIMTGVWGHAKDWLRDHSKYCRFFVEEDFLVPYCRTAAPVTTRAPKPSRSSWWDDTPEPTQWLDAVNETSFGEFESCSISSTDSWTGLWSRAGLWEFKN